MPSKATTPAQYLAELPDDRRALVGAIRDAINGALPPGYEEGMQYGMIGWFVPHARYPAGYHCDPKQPVPFVNLANTKGGASLYLFCVYVDPDAFAWFVDAFKETGLRLDMGKSCVRFKKLADVPLDLIARTVQRTPVDGFLELYTAQIPASTSKS